MESRHGFVDDITVAGQLENWHRLWQNTLAVLLELSKNRFMINLQNSCFCLCHVILQGIELQCIGYRLSAKFLKSLTTLTIPCTLKDLQVLLGKLLYMCPFIPKYKAIVALIEKLLLVHGPMVWTEKCTEAVSHLLQWVFARVEL